MSICEMQGIRWVLQKKKNKKEERKTPRASKHERDGMNKTYRSEIMACMIG